jgi:putative Holliday junction resolvase
MARTGVWLGVDVGTVRVGVAKSDPSGILATPVTTLLRDEAGGRDVDELVGFIREYQAVGVVIGLPRTLRGREGSSADMARTYAQALTDRVDTKIELVDERLTTVEAQRRLGEIGIRRKGQRAVVDQAAAVALLQHWLDSTPAR